MDIETLALAKKYAGGLTQAEVEKIVTDEVAKIVADAPEDFDTLKEMSDWISEHEESAAAMNSAIADNANAISDNEKAISDNTNAIDTNKTNISSIVDVLNGSATFQEDNTAVMTKTVPAGMGNYAGIKMIGGRTQKFNQQSIVTQKTIAVTIGDEGYTNVSEDTNNVKIIVGHTYYVRTRLESSTDAENHKSIILFDTSYGKWANSSDTVGMVYTAEATNFLFRIYGTAGSKPSGVVTNLVCDLTAMGLPNTTTAEEFEAMFPEKYYPYTEGELWNAPVESVVSCGRNKCKMIRGITVDPNHGAEVSKEGNSSSPYIKIDLTKEDVYFLRNTGNGINSYVVYFDDSKNFIGRSNAWTGEIILKGAYKMNNNGGNVTNPDNYMTDIKYIRVVYYSEVLANSNLAIISTDLGAGKPAYIPFFETTLLMPDALKSLPDWGVGDNYADLENNIYHHKFFLLDLSTVAWTQHATYPNVKYSILYGFGDTRAIRTVDNGILCSNKETNKSSISNMTAGEVRLSDSLYVFDDGDVSTTATRLKGSIALIELYNEELIGISDMLHPIRCESGGTITFTNEHSLDVPNTITYKKEVSING